jgi:glycosyltransferase involved in cell wall biosynthesis
LVRAFALAAHNTGARLILVGDGPDQPEARRVALEGGVTDQVTFLGERDILPSLLTPMTCFCLSSREESFGLSALEAMSCGTPVLATDVGGVAEVVEHGVSGILCAADDLETYAQAMRTMIAEPARAYNMGLAARERAVNVFARETVIPRYEAVYRRVLGEQS